MLFLENLLVFLRSFHKQGITTSNEPILKFKDALSLEDVRKKRRKIPKSVNFIERLFYSEWVKYAEQLKRYLDLFPTNQIKVIIYEDFKEDNQKIVNEICDFLDIERMNIERKKANVRKDVSFYRLRSFFLNSYRIRSLAQKILPYSIRNLWGDFVDKITLKEAKKKKIDPEFRKELMEKYKSEVVKLNNLLHEYDLIEEDRDLIEFWGYDQV